MGSENFLAKSFAKNPSLKSDLGGAFGYLFGENPFDEASKYLDQMPDALKYYDSFIDNAKDVYPYLKNYTAGGDRNFSGASDIFSKMADPNFQNFLGNYYKKSPGYDFSRQQGLDAISRASASSGMLGTPSDQFKHGQWATQFANQDYDKYMDRAFNTLMQSAQGKSMLSNIGGNIGSNIYGYGQKSADERATSMMNMLKTQAQNATYGAGYNDNGIGSLVNTGITLASLF